jgi:hypothetical protein
MTKEARKPKDRMRPYAFAASRTPACFIQQEPAQRHTEETKATSRSAMGIDSLLSGAGYTDGAVGWATFGCGASRFGVRGQAKRDPALVHSARCPSPAKRRRRCALPAHSKAVCRPSSGLLCNPQVLFLHTRGGLSASEERCLVVPKGQVRVAQRFNAGLDDKRSPVPKGRVRSNLTRHPSPVPSGLVCYAGCFPALKRRAILKMSLRDKGTGRLPSHPSNQPDAQMMLSKIFRGHDVERASWGWTRSAFFIRHSSFC